MRGMQVALDLLILSAAWGLAFLLRFELEIPDLYTKVLFFTWPYAVLFQYAVLMLFKVPRFAWRYVGLGEVVRILAALSTATAVLLVLRIGLAPVGGYAVYAMIPLGIVGIQFALAFMGVTGVRVLRRILAEREERGHKLRDSDVVVRRTLLIGAGRAGVMVAREVAQNPHLGFRIVGFIDDDSAKHGSVIHGTRVLGGSDRLAELAHEHGTEQAVISITSAPGQVIRRIVEACEAIALPVKIIPGIHEILQGRVNLSRIRRVTIEDLLGREAVELDQEAISAFIHGKRVVITGAGGSIGSELCRLCARLAPERLLLVEQAENGLFNIHSELKRVCPDVDAIPVIADVCDEARVEQIFADYAPDVVFHAAAHKHVPMMELNPAEAIKNNVFGTRTVAEAADRHGVGAFVLISTDKAVNPTSIMGATKRVAEITIQGLSQQSSTKFMGVRFGNVLGSAGSVIPIFREQIRLGGPVTVTHPEMARYFMTIPEACQLVLQTATMGRGGEIFVLDMGEPVKIVQMARDMIQLSGFSEDEIPITFVGVRPGEKLFEELSMDSEQMTRTRHRKIFIGKIETYAAETVQQGLEQLRRVAGSTSREEVRGVLRRVVPEMHDPDDVQPAPVEIDTVKSAPG